MALFFNNKKTYPNEILIDDRESKRNFVKKFLETMNNKIYDMEKKRIKIINTIFYILLTISVVQIIFFNYKAIMIMMVLFFIITLALYNKVIIYNKRLEIFNYYFRYYNRIRLDLFNI